MTSRTTEWRRRCRAREILSSVPLINTDTTDFSTDNSCEPSQLDIFPSNEDQSGHKSNDLNLSSQQSPCSSTDNIDSICSFDLNDPLLAEDIQNNLQEEESESDEIEDIEFLNFSAEPTTREIASILVVLKSRHNISNRCLDDICQLMQALKISKAPRSSAHIKRIFLPKPTTNFTSTKYFCSICKSLSSFDTHCSNESCQEKNGFSKHPPAFSRMNLKSQIKDILSRFPSLQSRQQSDSTLIDLYDITHGEVYKKIQRKEGDNFLSLTMNVDGIQIAKSSKSSLWVFTFVINEITKSERFKIQNVIIGGISSGTSKPTRTEIALYLETIYNELKILEEQHGYENNEGYIEHLRVFLIAACMDKPAQALVQNISEPNGAYGCGKCLIKGITVPVKLNSSKKIRVFPVRRTDERPKPRNNLNYDLKMAVPQKLRPTKKDTYRDYMYGYLGTCCLRELQYFDVGKSFAFDTLHNLYRGTFMRLLDIWFGNEHRFQEWSLISKINLIDVRLSTYKFPTGICRKPRSVLKYTEFKANELRSLLLFGFPIFTMYLPMKYSRHFLLLAIAAQFCESKNFSIDQISHIKSLVDEFIFEFPLLYGERQNVISIHTILHLTETIEQFGPVYNYSTFNFESYLGTLTAAVHSTRRHALEIQNNLQILRLAAIEINKRSFNLQMSKFISQIQPNIRNNSSSKSIESIEFKNINKNQNDIKEICLILGNGKQLYQTIKYNGIRFSTVQHQITTQTNDSCILYKVANKVRVGFITSIVKTVSDRNDCVIQVRDVPINRYLTINLHGTIITCKNVMFSKSDQKHSYFFLKLTDVKEKLVHVYDDPSKCFILFRFPNMMESS